MITIQKAGAQRLFDHPVYSVDGCAVIMWSKMERYF